MGRAQRVLEGPKWEAHITVRDVCHRAFGTWQLAFSPLPEVSMKDFRNLRVWEKSHRLTLDVYRATKGFPREEMYGLTSQMRRCSASISANIAEGCGKQGTTNSDVSCRSLPVRPASWTITCCWHATWVFSLTSSSATWIGAFLRYVRCLLRCSRKLIWTDPQAKDSLPDLNANC